jgi:hypothetical protein
MKKKGTQQKLLLDSQDSFLQATDKLISVTEDLLKTASTEEDLRIGFEKAIDPLCRSLGIELSPKYEKSTYKAGRSDALHGRVIIEYERPREMLDQVQDITHSQYTHNIVDFIFSNPWFATTRFRIQSNVPKTNTTRILKLLTDHKIITQAIKGSGRRPSLYIFPALLGIVK